MKTHTEATESVKNADIVIEAIVENIQIKQDLFQSLDKAAPRYLLLVFLS